MSQAPYVPFYTSDFLAGTSGMTSSAKGVYITLLCLMYETEAPLPQSWETLARRCGCTIPAFRRAIESLEDDGKLVVTDAGIWSQKCERHIAQRRERQRSATAAAKKRWEKDKENQSATDAAASSAQCQPEPEPEPKIKERDTNVSLALVAPCEPDRFSEFWSQYPHRNGAKKGKAAAEKAWAKAIKARASPQQIIAGALRYANDRQVIQGYAKDPATWLNAKGWEDEIERDANHNRPQNGRGMAGSATASEIADRGARWAASRAARR